MYKKSLMNTQIHALALSTIFFGATLALDLNSYRAQHGRHALSMSSELNSLAYAQAHAMAARSRIDHDNFRARVDGLSGGVHAENVLVMTCARPDAKPGSTFAGRACGCADEACAIRGWARSPGHRVNMLRGDVAAYGIASATGKNGRVYWALELGN